MITIAYRGALYCLYAGWPGRASYWWGGKKLSFHQRFMYLCFHKNNKQHNNDNLCFQQWLIIRNISWAANQHIRMIFKGSCDTGVNDAENAALEKITFKIYSKRKLVIFNCNNNSQYYCIFNPLNRALVSRRDLFQKWHLTVRWRHLSTVAFFLCISASCVTCVCLGEVHNS